MARAKLNDHNHIIENRYEKAEQLKEQGVNPFPSTWKTGESAQQVLDEFDGWMESERVVSVAGRVTAIRKMGKASFIRILDETTTIQVYLRKDDISEAAFHLMKSVLDMGDIAGVEGTLMLTKTGEKTIKASDMVLLAKSMRPMPEKYHGLKDVELRSRYRYVDLFANPEIRESFKTRAKVLRVMRDFLDGRGYLEVETPMMQSIYGGANARPFVTHHNALDIPLYLRIAPELYLKRLLVGGFEKVYEINRNFRNEGISVRHNPEFTMLELYTSYWDYNQTLQLTETLLRKVAEELGLPGKVMFGEDEVHLLPEGGWERLTVLQALKRETGVNFDFGDSKDVTLEKAEPFVKVADPKTTSVARIIMAVFESVVEPTLIDPTFITEFPSELSPLAKANAENPLVADRFELYIARMEIANAYSEQNHPGVQYEHFAQQLEMKEAGDDEAHQMDEDYITALEYGMPPASGLGIGIDRLVMLYTQQLSIRDVILFPLMKPLPSENPSDKPDSSDTDVSGDSNNNAAADAKP